MDLTSPLFDKIRIKPRRAAATAPKLVETGPPCSHPGCQAKGEFKAPKGRDRENEFFVFCKEHIRDYNATYDYFKGMDDDALAKFREADAVGHRPTGKMGPRGNQGAHVDETVYAEARTMRRKGARRTGDAAQAPRYNALALKALHTLDLDANATDVSIKARYKDLVKKHHPDANGGDRSSEEKLREIIQAYNFLRGQKLV
jgi:curved DNA-binding protein CbpA